jgi:carboxypeptidase Q
MTMKHTSLLLLVALATTAQAQGPVDLGTVARIKQEALANSQAMDHVSWMSDVYGPRLTGTPQMEEASKWAMKRFTEWGLANVHQERFAFGQGWTVERFSAHLVEPQVQPIIGFPRTYSPPTKGAVVADAERVDIRSEGDFAKYAGKLRGKIVLPQAARRVRMLEDRSSVDRTTTCRRAGAISRGRRSGRTGARSSRAAAAAAIRKRPRRYHQRRSRSSTTTA